MSGNISNANLVQTKSHVSLKDSNINLSQVEESMFQGLKDEEREINAAKRKIEEEKELHRH